MQPLALSSGALARTIGVTLLCHALNTLTAALARSCAASCQCLPVGVDHLGQHVGHHAHAR